MQGMDGSKLPNAIITVTTIGQLIERVCSEAQTNISLILCCTRTELFEALLSHVVLGTDAVGIDELGVADAPSPLIEPTLRLLAKGASTRMFFCPSIQQFRAIISTLPMQETAKAAEPLKLIVVDMLALHHGTSENTVQGLSRSFAMLASLAHRKLFQTELVECIDPHDIESPQKGSRLWDAEVPLLSGSVKIGQAGQGWAVRRITVRTFAERWFVFNTTP